MRSVLLCSVLLTLLCSPSLAQDAPPIRPGYFNLFLDGPGYTLTIEHTDGLISTIDVPKGVLLDVEAPKTDIREVNSAGAHVSFPLTLRGDIIVRTRRADTIRAGESDNVRAIMDKAPFKLSLTNVTLKVEEAGDASASDKVDS